jgi:hypothetical protein
MVLSLLADIRRSPSGVNLTVETEWSCPCSVRMFLYSFAVSQSLSVRSEEQVTGCEFEAFGGVWPEYIVVPGNLMIWTSSPSPSDALKPPIPDPHRED